MTVVTSDSDARRLDRQDAVFLIEWLADLLLSPLTGERVARAVSHDGQAALRWIGATLGAAVAAKTIRAYLKTGPAQEVSRRLGHRHAVLFEGIFRHRSLPLYESAWRNGRSSFGGRFEGGGRLFGEPAAEIQRLLRELDVHVSPNCAEPPDHLTIELAALAESLRRNEVALTKDLVKRLKLWCPRLTSRLEQADRGGVYAAAGQMLNACLGRLATSGRWSFPHRAASQDPI